MNVPDAIPGFVACAVSAPRWRGVVIATRDQGGARAGARVSCPHRHRTIALAVRCAQKTAAAGVDWARSARPARLVVD